MATIQIRRATAATATTNNVTLASGEIGFETDTGQIKIGDGVTAWNSLAYFAVSGSGDMLAATYDPATIAEQLVGLTATQSLTNKTLTSPVINTGVSGTGVLDDDTFATATATTLATSESIKAYVDASAGSSIPASGTGTAITFTEDTLWNEITYLTVGALVLDLTGAVKGVFAQVYCDSYVPTISGETFYISSGSLYDDRLNILSFFYDGTTIYLNIANVETLSPPSMVLIAGDTQVQIDWGIVLGADNYIIERSVDNFATAGTEVYNGALLTFTDTGLSNGTVYYYRAKTSGAGYFPSTYSSTSNVTPVGNDLLAYYRFNNDVTDSIGANNGTPTSITYGTGKSGQSAIFNNTTSKIIIADNSIFSFGNGTTDVPFSLSFFVKFTSISTDTFVGKRGASTNVEYGFAYDVGGYLEMTLFSGGTTAVRLRARYNWSPSTATWYHIYMTYNGSGTSAGVKFYVDGSYLGAITSADIGTYVAMNNTASTVSIGTIYDGGTGYLHGEMDGLGFHDTERSAAQVLADYNTQNGGSELA